MPSSIDRIEGLGRIQEHVAELAVTLSVYKNIMSRVLQIRVDCELMIVAIADVAHAYKVDVCMMREVLEIFDHICTPT